MDYVFRLKERSLTPPLSPTRRTKYNRHGAHHQLCASYEPNRESSARSYPNTDYAYAHYAYPTRTDVHPQPTYTTVG